MRSTMMDRQLTILSIMRHGAATFPDSVVLTCAGIGREPHRRTFTQIAERAGRLASGLEALGVGAGDRVATFQMNTAEHLEAYLAVPSMGAVLHTLNVRLYADQIAYVANHAEDKVVIVDHSLLPLFVPLIPDLKTVEHVIVCNGPPEDRSSRTQTFESYEDLLATSAPDFDWPTDLDEHSAASMCYTSGTTGNPKGVVYSHRSTWLHALGITTTNVTGIGEHDRVLPIAPMFHANAWGYPYAAWLSGADLLLPASNTGSDALAWFVEQARPTVSAAVPTILTDLLAYAEQHTVDLSSFRLILCGGSAVPLSLMQRYHDEYGVDVVQGWGMTETSPNGAVSRAPKNVPDNTESAWSYRRRTGRMRFGVEARIVRDGQPVAADGTQVGEIQVRGPWVTGSYYLNDDPSAFDDGWLRTGDVGTLDELGYIQITDRSKDVIKSGGEWISSIDLEHHLVAHPAVSDAAVIGVPDARWDERPLACVVRREGSEVTAQELRTYLGDRVAKWWLPERWSFIDAVPRTSVGKPDKKVLRGRYADDELEVTTLR